MNDAMLLKIANIAKVAWTARDLNQPVWRRLGGFAKESIPWSKGFTPSLTPKIESALLGGRTFQRNTNYAVFYHASAKMHVECVALIERK